MCHSAQRVRQANYNLSLSYLFDLIRLARPKQWTKNLLVFAALLVTKQYLNPDAVARTLAAFFAIAFVSSATYVINDLLDRERDAFHPKKKHRPLASGRVSTVAALLLAVILAACGLALGFRLGSSDLAVLCTYLTIQVLYNGLLKRVAVADVFVIASGFVLRAVLGAVVIQVQISGWLLFCTGAMALLLGFAKRRSEFINQGEHRLASREALAGYTKVALDAFVLFSAACTAMAYGIYSIESETAKRFPLIIVSTVFVCYGICRYLLIVYKDDEGGEPETLLFTDIHMILTILFFVISVFVATSYTEVPFLGR